MIIVDASLAAKWVLWEADSAAASDFLEANLTQIGAPELLFTEVASAIVRQGNIEKTLGADALQALERWTLAWASRIVAPYPVTPPRLFAAGRLALELGHQIYDCVYLALAMELDCELATCDRQFALKIGRIWRRTRLLSDYPA